MGGGTGTGAAPIVARIAREQGALAVAAVTRPFSFEGTQRQRIAKRGIAALTDNVHSLIVISNDRLLPVVGRTMSFDVALRVADDVLRQGIQGISELITRPGLVNLDFASIRTALEGAGGAIMAIGRGDGEGRAIQAAQSALSSPMLDSQLIANAATILVNITGGPGLTLHEVSEAARLISEAAHPEANILFGAVIDPHMGQESRVILVAGGIDSGIAGIQTTAGSEGEVVGGHGAIEEGHDHVKGSQPGKSSQDPLTEEEHGSRVSLVEPGQLLWTLPPAAQRAVSQAMGNTLEADSGRAHDPMLSHAPTGGLDRSDKGGRMINNRSEQPSILASRNTDEPPVPPDPPAAQTAATGATEDPGTQERDTALGKAGDRQKLSLRFLPNLDLPAFLRR
jgi:cell division GTPase FtsZ